MSTQNQEQDEVTGSGENDMQAGFSAFADGLGEVIEHEATEVESTDAEDSEEEQSTEEQVSELQQEAEKLTEAGLTKAEFDAQIRKVFGKIGELNSKIEQVSRSTPKLRINPEKFTRTRESFDDDFANSFASDLNDAVEVEYAPQPEAQQQDEPLEVKLEKKTNMAIVAGVHPDFREVVSSQEWSAWKSSLPVDVQNELDNTWDASFINPMLSKFKAQLNQQTQKNVNKNERLVNAITPRGGVVTAKTGLSEQDGFLAASKQFAKENGLGV
jgi:hypothetical protein